jgi:hypothetical protein
MPLACRGNRRIALPRPEERVKEKNRLAFHINPSSSSRSGDGRSNNRGQKTSRIDAKWRTLPDSMQTPTADLAAHPQIGARAQDHRLSRFTEQQLDGDTSSKGRDPGSGTDHVKQKQVGLQPEPGAFV